MAETTNLGLHIIETNEVVSKTPINENMEKIDEAIGALSIPINDNYSVINNGKYVNLFDYQDDVSTFKTDYPEGILFTKVTDARNAPFFLEDTNKIRGKYLQSITLTPNGDNLIPITIGLGNFATLAEGQSIPIEEVRKYEKVLAIITPSIDDGNKMTKYMLDGSDSRVEVVDTENILPFIDEDKTLGIGDYSTTGKTNFKYTDIGITTTGVFWFSYNGKLGETATSMMPIEFETSTLTGGYTAPELEKINMQIKNLAKIDNSKLSINQTTQDVKINVTTNSDGSLTTKLMPLDINSLPANFPNYYVTGESPFKENFYVIPSGSGYLLILSNKGELLFYRYTGVDVFCWRRYTNNQGLNRYCYLESVEAEQPSGGIGYFNMKLVVLNENFVKIDEAFMKKYNDDILDGDAVDNHDYIYLDDGHYVLTRYYKYQNSDLVYNAIQEVKNGKIIWANTTRDYPELLELSHTSTTTDYAHINSIIIDYDGNYMVSYRNIGIVKFDKETKNIMWIIGRDRNDFTGMDSRLIPFQQHDIKNVMKDGSYTIFDNYGHETQSRVIRLWLDESTMTATAKEYVSTFVKSPHKGSSTLIDFENEIFDITYGGGFDIGFEEYDFTNNISLMQVKFNDQTDMYRVWRDCSKFGCEPI